MLIFNGELHISHAFNGELSLENEVCGEFGIIEVVPESAADVYDGDYEVTPKFDSTTLETKDKFMVDNVVVKEIPVYKTRNASGGNNNKLQHFDFVWLESWQL